MTTRRHLWIALPALVVLAAAGCGSASGKPKSAGPGDKEHPPVPVTAETVGRATVKRTLILAGSVRPESEVRLFTKVAGRIEELKADTCDEVKKGQMVVRLDRELLAAGLKQAEAALQVAAAEVKTAQASLDDAERETKRAEDLFKQGVLNEQLRDKVRTALEVARAGRELSASRMVQAGAAVAAAKVTLDETEIRATIDGTVTHRYFDQGDFVSPGQPLFAIQDLRTVKVAAGVAQGDLPLVQPGRTRALVAVEGLAQPFDAAVTKLEPALDPVTLSAPIELRVTNQRRAAPGGAAAAGACAAPWVLVSGMSARVELDIEEHQDAAVLPLEALRNDGLKDFVFVLAPDGQTVKRRDVKVGIRSGALLEVLEPRDLAGARVVVQGVSRVTDGSKVQINGNGGGPAKAAPGASASGGGRGAVREAAP